MFGGSDRYCTEGKDSGVVHIDIVVDSVEEAFKHFDYISLKGRRLNGELENYIFGTVKNYPLSRKVKLVVHIPEEQGRVDVKILRDNIQGHFRRKVREEELYMTQQFREWRINMVIGVLFLVLCLILVRIADRFSYINFIGVIKESLMIVGWVALWDPLTFILFGWQPIRRDKLYYRKLSITPVALEVYGGRARVKYYRV